MIVYKHMIEEEVEVLKFEDVYIEKLRHKAEKTNKIRDWLSLLKAYEQNKLLADKDETIETMHFKFILKEEFWVQELNRKKSQSSLEEKDIEFLFMALQDGFYQNAAQIIFALLLGQLNLNSNRQSKGKLRDNYLIAKIETLLEMFKENSVFYSGLRNYYKSSQNHKKVRELYRREIKIGLDNHDVIYDEYCLWETSPDQLEASKQMYEAGKQAWELKDGSIGQLSVVARLNQPDRPHFDSIAYLELVEKLQTQTQKLRFLRIICLGRHELVNEYFQKLEMVHGEDEDYVKKCYEHVVELIPELQMGYLRFLVRRINKHVQKTQDEEYNNSWSEKVQYFRDRITHFIDKSRLTSKIQESIRELYYNYWIDVETSIVKDKASVCQLFEALLQLKRTVDVYTKYSQCLLRLEAYGDAKNVLKRSCEANKYDYEAYKQYEGYLAVYGTIKESIQFRKIKALEQSEQKKESEKEKSNMEIELNGIHDADRSKVKQNKIQDELQVKRTKTAKRQRKASEKNEIVNKQSRMEQESPPKKQTQTVHEPSSSRMQEEAPLPQKQPQIKEEHPKTKLHTDSGNTLFLKGFPNSYRETQIAQLLKNQDKIKEIRLVEKRGVFQNYCYIEMESAEAASKEIEENEHKDTYTIAISKPPSLYGEERTLFLCGLPFTATVEKIKNLFENEKQQIVDVRLKLDDSRSIAYVDFKSPQILKNVIQKYSSKGLTIDNKKILLKESQSKQKKQPRVVILKRLAFKATTKDIREFFKDYSLEDIFIPQNEDGRSKGFGFVKFRNQNEYRKALDLKEGELRGRKFEIVKSDREISRPKEEKRQQRSPESQSESKRDRNKEKSKKKEKDGEDKVDNSFFSNLFK